MHSFTQEDLIQYLYHETSPEKTAAIATALDSDWRLREEYELISSSHQQLETISLSPRKKAVDAILSYAERSVNAVTSEA